MKLGLFMATTLLALSSFGQARVTRVSNCSVKFTANVGAPRPVELLISVSRQSKTSGIANFTVLDPQHPNPESRFKYYGFKCVFSEVNNIGGQAVECERRDYSGNYDELSLLIRDVRSNKTTMTGISRSLGLYGTTTLQCNNLF